MKIIAGHHRGRQLQVPPRQITRPTAARTRESLFNILKSRANNRLANGVVMDCFAGSGAFGLESLSQGAAKVFFVENHPKVLPILQANIKSLKEEDKSQILRCDARFLPMAPVSASLVFLDPPYQMELINPCLQSLLDKGWLAENTLVIAETATEEMLQPPPCFTVESKRQYGAAKLWFLTLGSGSGDF